MPQLEFDEHRLTQRQYERLGTWRETVESKTDFRCPGLRRCFTGGLSPRPYPTLVHPGS